MNSREQLAFESGQKSILNKKIVIGTRMPTPAQVRNFMPLNLDDKIKLPKGFVFRHVYWSSDVVHLEVVRKK